MEGTLLVNQILSSSFAHVQYHHLAQLSLFPIRFYYQFNKVFNLNSSFYIYQSEDFNSFIQFLFNFVYLFKPNLLFLS
jgi:Hint domain-containing protein